MKATTVFRCPPLSRHRRPLHGAASRPHHAAWSRGSPPRASWSRRTCLSRRARPRLRSRRRLESGPSSQVRHLDVRRRASSTTPHLRTARRRAPHNRRQPPRRCGRARLRARATPSAASRTPPRARSTLPETRTRDVWTCVCAGAGSCGAWSRHRPPSANRARRPHPPRPGTTSCTARSRGGQEVPARTTRLVACGFGPLFCV